MNQHGGSEESGRAEERALVEIGQKFSLAPTTFSEAMTFARIAAHSSLVPKSYAGRPNDCLLAIQMGAELGLQPMQAIQNIAVINGRPSLWGDAMLAACQASPAFADINETFDEPTMTATCAVKRRGRETSVVRTFSRDDAELAQLWGKTGPWKQYPKRMLQMRARGFALRDAFPDVLRGFQCAEEQRDVDDLKHAGSSGPCGAPPPSPDAAPLAEPEIIAPRKESYRERNAQEAQIARDAQADRDDPPVRDDVEPSYSETARRALSCIVGAQTLEALRACVEDASQLSGEEQERVRRAYAERQRELRTRDAG